MEKLREDDLKTVIITGSTRGLGLVTTKELLKSGYSVIATGRKKTDEINYLINEWPDKLFFYPLDLSMHEEIHGWVKKVVKERGPIYGLINNAALGYDGVLATMHESQIIQLLNVNVLASILIAKYTSRSMLLAGGGRIINISSIIANTGFNGLSVYAASKAALNGFTKSLARELGKAKITVNTIAPGYMETDMTKGLQGDKLASIKRRSPLGKLAEPEDVTHSILFLLSDNAKSITGTTLTVDGGSTA